MGLNYVVDTSVLTRIGHESVRNRLSELAKDATVSRASIVDLEVGYAARNEAEWDDLMGALATFVVIPTTEHHVNRALQVQRMLASRSQRGRKLPDLLVAAAAEEVGYTVVHYDADFDLIAVVTGQGCEWIVERGSVD